LDKHFANIDGFRCYKVKNRGDQYGDRLFIAPVYVIGLPGDVDLLNREMDTAIFLKSDLVNGVNTVGNSEKKEAAKRLKGECLEEAIGKVITDHAKDRGII